MDIINFEYYAEITLKDYLSIWKTPIKYNILRVLIILVVDILLCLNKYTIPFSIILTLSIIIVLLLQKFYPSLIKLGNTYNYNESKYLHHKILIKVDEKGVYIIGKYINSFSSWFIFKGWHIKNKYLIFYFSGIEPVYFPTSLLIENGIYDNLLNYMKKYGHEFK